MTHPHGRLDVSLVFRSREASSSLKPEAPNPIPYPRMAGKPQFSSLSLGVMFLWGPNSCNLVFGPRNLKHFLPSSRQVRDLAGHCSPRLQQVSPGGPQGRVWGHARAIFLPFLN